MIGELDRRKAMTAMRHDVGEADRDSGSTPRITRAPKPGRQLLSSSFGPLVGLAY